jgi:transposase-like protein
MPESESSTATTLSKSRHEGSACPNCGTPNVHRSHRKGITEHVLAVVGGRIRRCHSCNARFARLFNSNVYIDDARRALRRIAVGALMVVGAALVVGVMVWLMNKQAAIGPSDGSLFRPGGFLA